MGVAKEYPDLYGTKPGTKAASLWDQWHVLQEQNKPKTPVEKYHIDFNSNKVETSVAQQIAMSSIGVRQITAPSVTSYQAYMAPQPGAFVTSNPPIGASQRLAPQPEALEKANSSSYAPQIPMQLLGARQRTAPCVSPYHSMASQPRAFITPTLPISAPQFESSHTSTSSTYTPQIPMQVLGDRQRTAPHVLNHHSMASQPGTFITSNQPIGAPQSSAPQLGASDTSTPQIPMALLGARQRTAHCVTTYQTIAPGPGAYNTSNPHSGASQTSTSSICAPHTAAPYLKNHLLEPPQLGIIQNSAPQVSNSLIEASAATLPYYTSHQAVAPHQITSRISSSIWAPELTVSLVPNPKTLTPQMPKRGHLQQFSSQHRAPQPEIRDQQFKSQHRKAPQFQTTAPQVGAQRLGNREQGLPNKAMHFRSPQYNYHQQKSPQLGAIQHGAPNLSTNYLSPPKENGILYSGNSSKGIDSSNQNFIQREYLPTQILGSSTGPDRYWVNHPVVGQPGPLTPPYLEPNGEFESEHFKVPKPVKSKPDKKFMLPPIFKPEISKKCVKQGWKQRALLHYSQKSD